MTLILFAIGYVVGVESYIWFAKRMKGGQS